MTRYYSDGTARPDHKEFTTRTALVNLLASSGWELKRCSYMVHNTKIVKFWAETGVNRYLLAIYENGQRPNWANMAKEFIG